MEKFHRNSIKINAREPQRLNNRILYTSIVEENKNFKIKSNILTSIINTNPETTTKNATIMNQVNINISFIKLWCLGNWCL